MKYQRDGSGAPVVDFRVVAADCQPSFAQSGIGRQDFGEQAAERGFDGDRARLLAVRAGEFVRAPQRGDPILQF